MDIFHDRKADRITLIQSAHPFVAWGALLPLTLAAAASAVAAWMAGGFLGGLLALTCVAGMVPLGRLTVWVATEAVARFDGTARSLTLVRRRPWGEAQETVPFGDVHDIATAEIWLPDGKDYRVDIMLAGERRIRLRSNGERAVDDALAEIRRMIRR